MGGNKRKTWVPAVQGFSSLVSMEGEIDTDLVTRFVLALASLVKSQAGLSEI